MASPADAMAAHKVRRASGFALRRIAAIAVAEHRIDAAKAGHARCLPRYGMVLLLLVCAVSARFLGVI